MMKLLREEKENTWTNETLKHLSKAVAASVKTLKPKNRMI
jgi:hypothetical protein